MLRRLWLIFAQATTIGLALLFIVSTLRPEWLARLPAAGTTVAPALVPALKQAAPTIEVARAAAFTSYADAVATAAPAVVNVYTTKEVQRRGAPVDPLYRYFFGDPRGGPDRVASLGSGVIAIGRWLRPDQQPRGSGRRRDRRRPVRRPSIRCAAGGSGPRERSRLAQGRSQGTAGHHVRSRRLPAGRRHRAGDRQPVRRRPDSDDGHRFRARPRRTSASIRSRTSSRPTPPSTRATRAAPWSTPMATSSASTPRSFLAPAARSASDSRFPPRSSSGDGPARQDRQGGRVAIFGVEPEDLTPELAELLKLTRATVSCCGRAAYESRGKAGLEPGDVMLTINGQPVKNRRGMLNQISQLPPGCRATVRVLARRQGSRPAGDRRRTPAPRVPHSRARAAPRGSATVGHAFARLVAATGSPPAAAGCTSRTPARGPARPHRPSRTGSPRCRRRPSSPCSAARSYQRAASV